MIESTAQKQTKSAQRITLVVVAALVGLMALLAALGGSPLTDGDFGWHMMNGEMILRTGRIVHQQLLAQASYGTYWSDTAWLWDVLAALCYNVFSWRGIVLLLAATSIALGAIVGAATTRMKLPWALLAAVVVGLGVSVAMPARPETVSYPLFALTLVALQKRREGDGRWLLASTAALALWVNLHSSWPLWFAVVVWEIPWTEKSGHRPLYLALGAGAAVALLAQMSSLGAFLHFAGHVASGGGNLNVIQEWMSPNFHRTALWPVLAMIAVLAPVLASSLVRGRDWGRLGWLCGATAAALFAARFIPYAAIGYGLLLAGMPGLRQPGAVEAGRMAINRALAAVVALLCITAPFALGFAQSPVRADIQYLRAQHAQDVFDDPQYGGALEIAGVAPYVDGRNDIWLAHPYWQALLRVFFGEAPVADFLQHYDPGARWAIWSLGDPVAWQLDGAPGWRLVAAHGGVGVWRRESRRSLTGTLLTGRQTTNQLMAAFKTAQSQKAK